MPCHSTFERQVTVSFLTATVRQMNGRNGRVVRVGRLAGFRVIRSFQWQQSGCDEFSLLAGCCLMTIAGAGG